MRTIWFGLGLAVLGLAWSIYRLPQADLLLSGLVFCQ
jgi:hypothetical protein